MRSWQSPWRIGSRRSTSSLMVRCLVLCGFVTGTVGLPADLSGWLPGATGTCRATPGAVCRCSLISQKMGTCCCSRGQSRSSMATCHATPSQPVVGSCCAKRAPASSEKPATAPRAKSEPTLQISSCPCGPSSPSTSILQCSEPRLLTSAAQFTSQIKVIAKLSIGDVDLFGLRLPPDLPPPKQVTL